MKWILAPLVAFVVTLIPSVALAEEGDDDDVLIRIGGVVIVARGETIGSIFVIDGNAVIEGSVRDNVVVINGTSTVTGSIGGNLTVVSGIIDLKSGAAVVDVNSIDSDLIRAQGVNVTGEINDPNDLVFLSGVAGALSFLFWGAMTFAVLAAGMLFAAVGGRQLADSARAMTGNIVNTLLGIILVWIGIPIVAVIAMATLLGIPLGIGLLVFLMPGLWFLGYLVAGAALGSFLVGLRRREATNHPYLATFAGLMLLQLGILIPVLGSMVAFAAGLWGAGALAYIAFRAAGGKGISASNPAAQGQGQAQPAV